MRNSTKLFVKKMVKTKLFVKKKTLPYKAGGVGVCEVGSEMSGSIRRHIVREIAVVALANPGCEDYFTMGIF